jgi:hypothetical protein
MSKKLESLLIVHEDQLWINVSAAGYDGEGMLIATIGGCEIHPKLTPCSNDFGHPRSCLFS